jgi:CheY-like chemotaxis protein
VRDTGVGIPADKIGLLFQKFVQADASTTRKHGGTGLGLAISKQLVELMGGEIGVRSEPGKGSEFWFTSRFERPRAGEAIVEITNSPSSQHPTANGGLDRPNRYRVLVAEDNMTNQQVALGMLSKLGVRAEAVANGREAVTALQNTSYDLVLMDVQMPEMDGLEATHVIRSTAGRAINRAVPIIALTAHAMVGDREACIKAGMDDYIAKPVTSRGLATLLETWLAVPKAPPCQAPTAEIGEHAPFDEPAFVETLAGDLELARAIARTFLADTPTRLDAIWDHLDAGDTNGVAHQAHTIKGAAAAVHAADLASSALALEKASKTGDLESARTASEKLRGAFEQLRKAMEDSSLLRER